MGRKEFRLVGVEPVLALHVLDSRGFQRIRCEGIVVGRALGVLAGSARFGLVLYRFVATSAKLAARSSVYAGVHV